MTVGGAAFKTCSGLGAILLTTSEQAGRLTRVVGADAKVLSIVPVAVGNRLALSYCLDLGDIDDGTIFPLVVNIAPSGPVDSLGLLGREKQMKLLLRHDRSFRGT